MNGKLIVVLLITIIEMIIFISIYSNSYNFRGLGAPGFMTVVLPSEYLFKFPKDFWNQSDEIDLFSVPSEGTLGDIRNLIWRQIEELQEHGNCNEKKILQCEPRSFSGFGSMVHRYGVCIQVAYALGRIFFIHQKEYQHFRGLHQWLLPDSQKCSDLKQKVRSFKSICSLNEPKCYLRNQYEINNSYKVLTYSPQPGFPAPRRIPGTIPESIEKQLIKLNVSDPKLWFAAQFLGYLLLRPNKMFRQLLENFRNRIGITFPYMAMHIRHGDKLKKEAKYIAEKKFMRSANEYFKKEILINTTRKIYVASDDNAIESKLCKLSSPNNQIIMLPMTYRKQGFHSYFRRNFPKDVLETLLIDLYFLTYANFTVCTWTSNIGRLVHLLKHALYSYDATNKTVSLDRQVPTYQFFGYAYVPFKSSNFVVTAPSYYVCFNETLMLSRSGELLRRKGESLGNRIQVETVYSRTWIGYVNVNDTIEWPGKPSYHFYP